MIAACALVIALTDGSETPPAPAFPVAGGGEGRAGSANGLIRRDPVDPFGTLTLDNRTKKDPPGPARARRAAINWWANGEWIWQTGFDVHGEEHFVLLYRRAPEAEDSRDVIFVTNELYPKIGILQNNPAAALDVQSHVDGRPALVAGATGGSAGWIARFDTESQTVSGIDNQGRLALGFGSPPTHRLQLEGSTEPEGGIGFGEDVQLYRSADGTLTVGARLALPFGISVDDPAEIDGLGQVLAAIPVHGPDGEQLGVLPIYEDGR